MWFKEKEQEPVMIGAEYEFRDDNPFQRHYVKVKDAKEGWVLYAMYPYDDGVFQRETLKEVDFLRMYKLKEPRT